MGQRGCEGKKVSPSNASNANTLNLRVGCFEGVECINIRQTRKWIEAFKGCFFFGKILFGDKTTSGSEIIRNNFNYGKQRISVYHKTYKYKL